jgi:hypothetical protein
MVATGDHRTSAAHTIDMREKYERLNIVVLDGAAFIARRDNPGTRPGDGWEALSRQRPARPQRRDWRQRCSRRTGWIHAENLTPNRVECLRANSGPGDSETARDIFSRGLAQKFLHTCFFVSQRKSLPREIRHVGFTPSGHRRVTSACAPLCHKLPCSPTTIFRKRAKRRPNWVKASCCAGERCVQQIGATAHPPSRFRDNFQNELAPRPSSVVGRRPVLH